MLNHIHLHTKNNIETESRPQLCRPFEIHTKSSSTLSQSLATIQAVMFEFDDFKSHSSKDIQTFSRPPLRLMWDGIANESWIVYTFSADRITWLICISLSHLSMGYVVPSVPCVTTLAFWHCMDQWAILLWCACCEVDVIYLGLYFNGVVITWVHIGSGDHLKGDWNEIPTREWPVFIETISELW